MKLTLSHYDIDPNIVISETDFFTLSVENKAFLFSLLTELREQIESGRDGGFNLLINDKSVNIEKSASVIFDFTDIDFNSKKITNLLIKNFSEFLTLGEQLEAISSLESSILNLAEDFRIKSGINIEYDTAINGTNLAKVCSLKIAEDKATLIERLCEYVNLLCDLKPLKLFVLVFGKQFLDSDNIKNFYKYCADKNVRLLIVEGTDKTERISNEKRMIIDSDLCAITQNYND